MLLRHSWPTLYSCCMRTIIRMNREVHNLYFPTDPILRYVCYDDDVNGQIHKYKYILVYIFITHRKFSCIFCNFARLNFQFVAIA